MTKEQTIHSFFASFGLPAYEESAVPDGAEMPRITYSVSTSAFLEGETALTGSVWYRSTSWRDANAKANEISTRIGQGGIVLRCDGGAIWLKRGTPFAQSVADDDDAIRRKYINITAEFLTAD